MVQSGGEGSGVLECDLWWMEAHIRWIGSLVLQVQPEDLEVVYRWIRGRLRSLSSTSYLALFSLITFYSPSTAPPNY